MWKWSVVFLLLGVYIYRRSSTPKVTPNNQPGYYAPGWKKVVDVYRRHLDSGWQQGGAFAVYYKGELVAEISGGYADETAHWEWTNNTLSQYFSTTKGVAAVVMAMLVDRGLLDYNKPISHYWPEFAQNGKKDITVIQLLTHQSALAIIDEPYSFLDILEDNAKVSRIFAAQKPSWTPGDGISYHALSLGMYEDQIVKRVDPKHRSLAQFFADEVAKPFDIDFHIGLPRAENFRCARNINKWFSFYDEYLRVISNWKLFYKFLIDKTSLVSKVLNNPPNMGELDGFYNQPAYRAVPNPSTSGFGTAIGAAKLFGILANGGIHKGKRLLSQKLIDMLTESLIEGNCRIMGLYYNFGRGVNIWPSPKGSAMFGTKGGGGQHAKSDPKYKVGLAFLTNHMTMYDVGIDPRLGELEETVYEIIEQLESSK